LTLRVSAPPPPPPQGDPPLRVLTCSWNCGNAPAGDLSLWIPKGGVGYDIIAVGLMECTFTEKAAKKQKKQSEKSSEGEGVGADDDEDEADVDLDAPVVVEAQKEEQMFDALKGSTLGKKSHRNVNIKDITVSSVLSAVTDAASSAAASVSNKVQTLSDAMKNSGVQGAVSVLATDLSSMGTCATMDLIKEHVGKGFECVVSMLMVQIGLLVFIRRKGDNLPNIDKTKIFTHSEGTGAFGMAPNKGGNVARIIVGGTTSITFVATHLAAHMKYDEVRDLNAMQVINNARFGEQMIDVDAQSHHTIWMGDLNYRIDLGLTNKETKEGGEKVLRIDNKERFDQVQSLLNEKKFDDLYAADQLRNSIENGKAFTGFKEAPITFPFTFKVKRQDGYHYNPQRVSSWCDRILFKSLPSCEGNISVKSYEAISKLSTSDHKPVRAAFEIDLEPKFKFNPLPTTSFDKIPTYPVLTVSSLVGENLLALDYTGFSDPYCTFFTDLGMWAGNDALRSTVSSTSAPKTDWVVQNLNPKWKDVIEMKISAKSIADLERSHLIIALQDHDDLSLDDRLGQAVIPFNKIAAGGGKEVPFRVPVIRSTRQEGWLSGKAKITWPKVGEVLKKTTKTSDQASTTKCCEIA
jgi:hypothetical protein